MAGIKLLKASTSDSALAEVILPELVWQKILDFLTYPEDIINSSKTCTLFRRLLHPPTLRFMKLFPLLFNYLDRSTILECRLLSKKLHLFVDHFLCKIFTKYYMCESKPHQFPSNFNHYTCNDIRTKAFLWDMKSQSVLSPFVANTIHFTISPTSDLEFNYLINDFLESFGEHIYTLKLDISFCDKSPEWERQMNHFIRYDFFLLLPNLKNLVVDGNLWKPYKLGKIKRNYPEEAVHNLEKLLIPSHDWIDTERTWPKLRELQITDFVIDLYYQEQKDFATLKRLHLPNLERLALKVKVPTTSGIFRESATYEYIELIECLKILSNSSPNLKSLKFYAANAGNNLLFYNVSNRPQAEMGLLYNIKELEVEVWDGKDHFNCVLNYKFLFQFPNLEKLSLVNVGPARWLSDEKNRKYYANEQVQIVKLGYKGRLYESNVWELFPSLKELRFGKKIYSRTCYKRMKRSKSNKTGKKCAII